MKMTKKQRAERVFDVIVGVMLFIVVGIMPLVVRGIIRTVPPESNDIFIAKQDVFMYYGRLSYVNFFSYWKAWFLYLPAVVIAFYYISDRITTGMKSVELKSLLKNPVVVASGVFLLFVFISAVFSDFTATAWRGTKDRSEGVWAWLAYFTVFFGAMYYVRKPIHAKVILWGLIFSSIVMGLIGLSQFVQNDFFNTALGQRLVLGGILEYVPSGEQAETRFTIANGTLFNPNTFGLYTAMLSPVLLISAIVYRGKIIVNVLLFISGGLMLAGVFGSRSLGGAVGIAAAVGVVAVTLLGTFLYRMYNHKAPRRKFKKGDIFFWLGGVVVLACMITAMFIIDPIRERIQLARTRFETALRTEPLPVYDFFFEGDTMRIYLDDAPLFTAAVEVEIHPEAVPDNDTPWITVRSAGDGGILPPVYIIPAENHVRYYFDIPGYRRIQFVNWRDHFRYDRMLFVRMDGTIYGLSAALQIIDMEERIPAFGFRGRENWGSNRGYIFSRSFPLFPRHAVIGSGPDSFVNAFPQHDIIGKWQGMNRDPYIIVDKAHNIYIQTWITTGGISMLALIFLFGHYLVTTFLSLVRTKGENDRFVFGLRLGLLAGVAAFCVASMATDSTIGSTGVFFVLLGLGYGVERLIPGNTTVAGK